MGFHKVGCFVKSKKVNYLLQKIIRLKEDNRSISDKIKSFENTINNNSVKCVRFYTEGHGDASYVYEKRVNRDINTVVHLKKLQEYNSSMINKYRDKIKYSVE